MSESLKRIELLLNTPSSRIRALPELVLSGNAVADGRYRIPLYRYLSDNLPIVSACVWTWVRLTAAPGGVFHRERRL